MEDQATPEQWAEMLCIVQKLVHVERCDGDRGPDFDALVIGTKYANHRHLTEVRQEIARVVLPLILERDKARQADLFPDPESSDYMKSSLWTLKDAIQFIRALEKWLYPNGLHCALGGSVLHRGYSTKDLDLVVYPRNTAEHLGEEELREHVHTMLERFGLRRTHKAAWIREQWKRKGSSDAKWVEAYKWEGTKRVDVFTLT